MRGSKNFFYHEGKSCRNTELHRKQQCFNLRHFDALNRAKENLQYARKSIDEKLTGEFIAVDLRNAENALSEIIGKVTTEDILNNIFTKFCVGK